MMSRGKSAVVEERQQEKSGSLGESDLTEYVFDPLQEPETPQALPAENRRRRSPSRQPGYVTQSRVGTVGLTAHVPPELRTAVNMAARRAGVTTQEFLVAVLSYAVAEQQPDYEPAKVAVGEAIRKYQEAQRRAVREAALQLAKNLT